MIEIDSNLGSSALQQSARTLCILRAPTHQRFCCVLSASWDHRQQTSAQYRSRRRVRFLLIPTTAFAHNLVATRTTNFPEHITRPQSSSTIVRPQYSTPCGIKFAKDVSLPRCRCEDPRVPTSRNSFDFETYVPCKPDALMSRPLVSTYSAGSRVDVRFSV